MSSGGGTEALVRHGLWVVFSEHRERSAGSWDTRTARMCILKNSSMSILEARLERPGAEGPYPHFPQSGY